MEISGQFIRYAIVGLVSNGVLYGAYLALTWFGLGHKMAMTLLYILGVLQTFVFNRNWSFKHGGLVGSALVRYVFAYGLGYLLNYGALVYLVDVRGYPHQIIQGGMIVFLAFFLFALQRYWVFQPHTSGQIEVPPGSGRPK